MAIKVKITKHKYNIGDKVRVKALHPVEKFNPDMQRYLGAVGTVELLLPAELGFSVMYRVVFDNSSALQPLAFMARALEYQ